MSRDQRGSHESTSAFGQITHDWGPTKMGWMDLDGVVHCRVGNRLLLIEHKRAGGRLSDSQREILLELERFFTLDQQQTTPRFHPDSGVYVLVGDVGGEGESCETCGQPAQRSIAYFIGPQKLYRLSGTLVFDFDRSTQEKLFGWMCPHNKTRHCRRTLPEESGDD